MRVGEGRHRVLELGVVTTGEPRVLQAHATVSFGGHHPQAAAGHEQAHDRPAMTRMLEIRTPAWVGSWWTSRLTKRGRAVNSTVPRPFGNSAD